MPDEISVTAILHAHDCSDEQIRDAMDSLFDALDSASDQDRITYLNDGGKRVAAIVPVADAEYLVMQENRLHRFVRRSEEF